MRKKQSKDTVSENGRESAEKHVFGQVGFGQVGFGQMGFGQVGFGQVGFGQVG